MALIDYHNKVIYWDEVNWQWLPFLRIERSGNCYLVKEGIRIPVNSAEEIIKALKDFDFFISTLQSLGFTEISQGCFLYKGKLYQVSKPNSSVLTLLATITESSKTWVSKQINGKGVLSKEFVDDLVLKTSKILFRGKLYRSYNTLAKDVGLSSGHIYNCLAEGKTLEEIIDEHENNFVTDHKGDKFPSIVDMCKHWGISKNAYYRRLSRGWSLEKALSFPIKKVRKSKSYVDFNGNVFTSASSLAKEYGVSFRVITRLLDKGKTAEEITRFLSKRTKGEFMYEDHLGNKYPTYSKMAEAYGINTRLFATRRNRGWTIEEALTKPSKVKKNSNSQK